MISRSFLMNASLGLAIFSVFFSPIPIYIPVFILNIVVCLLHCYVWNRASFLSLKYKLVWPFLLFISSAIFVLMVNKSTSDMLFFFKAIINLFFAIAWINVLSKRENHDLLKWSFLGRLLFLVIFLNFIQVFYIVAARNLWTIPFNLGSSMDAYLISSMDPLIGNLNKNIWSSKFALICVFYLKGVKDGVFVLSNLKRLVVSSIAIITVIYLTSRTGVSILFIYFGISFFLKLREIRNSFLKSLSYTLFLTIGVLSLFFFIKVILRFETDVFDVSHGHEGDGFKARILLWIYLFSNTADFNLFLGNGIMFAGYFFKGVFSENNLHNTFLNIWLDLGFWGLFSYIMLFSKSFLGFSKSLSGKYDLVLPFLACLMIQYSGYDNDLFLYLMLLWAIDIEIQKKIPKIC